MSSDEFGTGVAEQATAGRGRPPEAAARRAAPDGVSKFSLSDRLAVLHRVPWQERLGPSERQQTGSNRRP
jgi:hypothetical protein